MCSRVSSKAGTVASCGHVMSHLDQHSLGPYASSVSSKSSVALMIYAAVIRLERCKMQNYRRPQEKKKNLPGLNLHTSSLSFIYIACRILLLRPDVD